MLQDIRTELDAEKAFGSVTFPFFIEKEAPVSKQKSMLSYQCSYEGSVSSDESEFFVTICVPVTTLCPCSKAISQNGAHNQRGNVTVKLKNSFFFWIEDVIKLIEDSASCAIYSLLKREDEKFVTEKAYENPRFVEDVVREGDEIVVKVMGFDEKGKVLLSRKEVLGGSKEPETETQETEN